MSTENKVEAGFRRSIPVVLCLGSNHADRESAVRNAATWLGGFLEDLESSEIYETPACGSGGEGAYMNAVVRGYLMCDCQSCEESLSRLEKTCKEYERACGRDEKMRARNLVPIDIDIIIAGTKILRPADYEREFFLIGYRLLCD